jgi:hypothetical protein
MKRRYGLLIVYVLIFIFLVAWCFNVKGDLKHGKEKPT